MLTFNIILSDPSRDRKGQFFTKSFAKTLESVPLLHHIDFTKCNSVTKVKNYETLSIIFQMETEAAPALRAPSCSQGALEDDESQL